MSLENEMKVYRVYHNVNLFGPNRAEAPDFKLVAEVEASDLDEVFQMTNSIDAHWSMNEGVKVVVPAARSTSVGDRIETPEGRTFVVDGVGFTEVLMVEPVPEALIDTANRGLGELEEAVAHEEHNAELRQELELSEAVVEKLKKARADALAEADPRGLILGEAEEEKPC